MEMKKYRDKFYNCSTDIEETHIHIPSLGIFELANPKDMTKDLCGYTYDLDCTDVNCPDNLDEIKQNITPVGHDLKANYEYTTTVGDNVYLKKYYTCNRNGCTYQSSKTPVVIDASEYVDGSEYKPNS